MSASLTIRLEYSDEGDPWSVFLHAEEHGIPECSMSQLLNPPIRPTDLVDWVARVVSVWLAPPLFYTTGERLHELVESLR